MTAQLSIAYKPSYEGNEAWERQLEVLRKAVEHLTRKEVCWEIGVTEQALGDALFERDRKRWAAKWTHIVKAMLHRQHDEVSRDLLRRLADTDLICTPFAVRDSDEITPEEMAIYNRVDAALKKKGRR